MLGSSIKSVTQRKDSHISAVRFRKKKNYGSPNKKNNPLMAPHAQQEAKKRKHADHGDNVASKKSRMTVLNTTPSSEFSAFSEVSIRLYIHLAPMWVSKPVEGINEQLNAFLMKYVKPLLPSPVNPRTKKTLTNWNPFI